MNYSFQDYENAVLEALTPLKQENDGYLKVLKAYAGELGSEDALKRFFVINFPAVLVKVSRAEYEPADLECVRQTVTVDLLICARSYRSQDEARKGETGVYKILRDIRGSLSGNKLGLSIRPVMPRREWELGSTPQLVFYAAQYIIINDCV